MPLSYIASDAMFLHIIVKGELLVSTRTRDFKPGVLGHTNKPTMKRVRHENLGPASVRKEERTEEKASLGCTVGLCQEGRKDRRKNRRKKGIFLSYM